MPKIYFELICISKNRSLNFRGFTVLTSFASCLRASSYSPFAAYSRPRFLYSFDLIALEHSGVFNTVHWAWAKYSSACSSLPSPRKNKKIFSVLKIASVSAGLVHLWYLLKKLYAGRETQGLLCIQSLNVQGYFWSRI